ncbi:MAG: c-type cytochrome domain-containing protein, partial [Limisphaerales bacterium]
MPKARSTPSTAPSWILSLLLASAPPAWADDRQAKQPSPALSLVDFDHDIRPIFETSCLRCHGPERPKSHFRLDNRESALKGGNDGQDILPGHGAESPLLRRVSSTNEDTQMPPPGKGEPLTPAQIGLLRAWIDQGADWGATNAGTRYSFDLAPQFVWIGVHGDKGEFRQIEGMKDGYSGGVEHFGFQDQISAGEKLSVEGHYLSGGQDAGLQLNLTKNDVGFIHTGFEQWRQYYDNFGWHDSAVTPPGLPSAGSLSLDEGRAWIDFGLTLPRGPQVVLGYEEQFRTGYESTLDWGPLGGKNIAPSTEAVDEHTHIAKLDISGDVAGWHVEDNARVEIHHQDNKDDESSATGPLFQTQDKYDDVQGMNTLTLGKMVRDWWSVSFGYYYARLEGSDALNQSGPPPMIQYWQSPQVTLSTASQILSASSLFRPLPSLSLGLDTQFEWTHESG